MKKMKPVIWAVAVVAAGLLSFKTWHQSGGTIKGTVSPANGATEVRAYSGTDSFASPVSSGNFEIKNLNAGTYKLKVVAVSPYKESLRDGITVKEGETTEVGEIHLEQ